MINLKITDKNGIKLLTKDKFCNDDINVTVDENLLGGVQIVDKLPTNPKENVIYEEKEYSDIDVFIIGYTVYNDTKYIFPLKEIIEGTLNISTNIFYYVVDELPTTPLECDFATFTNLYVYICNDIPYAYGNLGYGNMWLPVSQILTNMDQNGYTYIDKGFANSYNYVNIPSVENEVYLNVTYKKRIGINNKNGIELFANGNYIDYEKILDKTIETFSNKNITCIPSRMFSYYRELKKVYIPNVVFIKAYAFQDCHNLEEIDISNAISIYEHSFNSCIKLRKIIIRQTNRVCSCRVSSFTNCFQDVEPTIYVPDILLEQYKSATNWCFLAEYIKPLSEYMEE